MHTRRPACRWSPPTILAASLTLASLSIPGPAAQDPSAVGPAVRASAGAAVDRHLRKVDPGADGWSTEAFHEATAAPFKRLGEVLAAGGPVAPGALDGIAAADFEGGALRPAVLAEVWRAGSWSVRRAPGPGTPTSFRGTAGLAAALTRWLAALPAGATPRASFKEFSVERRDGFMMSRVYAELFARTPQESVQQNAVWECRWRIDGTNSPVLTGIHSGQFEEVRLQAPGGRLFSDISEAALGANRCWREDGLPGLGPFLGQVSRLEGMSRYGHHGLAMGDVNGDGLEDVYAPNAGGLPNHLFLQNPDGTFTEQAAAWQVDFLENCSGALLVDLDNDGRRDLVVAGVARVLVLRNNGRGQFELRGSFGGVSDPMSLSAADYDRDGRLDLYICGYMATPGTTRIFSPVPYHDANNGGRNALLRNEGGFRFRDVTVETGLDEHNRRFSFAAAWDDFDGDGWPDLYVANDFGRNNLFHNNRGTFRDVADATGTEDTGAGMSACWGDVNRDGRPDLYVGNMFSSAGQRVAYQPEFATRQAPDATRAMQRMARGNSLLINIPRAGQPAFTDVSEPAAVTLGRWAWASRVADLNNDGWPDLLVANGYISGEDPHDL